MEHKINVTFVMPNPPSDNQQIPSNKLHLQWFNNKLSQLSSPLFLLHLFQLFQLGTVFCLHLIHHLPHQGREGIKLKHTRAVKALN